MNKPIIKINILYKFSYEDNCQSIIDFCDSGDLLLFTKFSMEKGVMFYNITKNKFWVEKPACIKWWFVNKDPFYIDGGLLGLINDQKVLLKKI